MEPSPKVRPLEPALRRAGDLTLVALDGQSSIGPQNDGDDREILRHGGHQNRRSGVRCSQNPAYRPAHRQSTRSGGGSSTTRSSRARTSCGDVRILTQTCRRRVKPVVDITEAQGRMLEDRSEA
jgi:hypothetical protein